MNEKQKYCLGFIFSKDLSKILLIKKLRSPKGLNDKMLNKLNGIGGHCEIGENPYNAMVRECKEETGLDITDFSYFCCLESEFGSVYCFYSVTDDIFNYKQLDDEKLEIFRLENSSGYLPEPNDCFKNYERMNNIDWLIIMALNQYKGLDDTYVFTVIES